MDRKGFLKALWHNLFKPLLLLGVLIFSIRLLIRIFTQNDIERMIAILVIGLIILFVLTYFFGLLFKTIITSKPDNFKTSNLGLILLLLPGLLIIIIDSSLTLGQRNYFTFLLLFLAGGIFALIGFVIYLFIKRELKKKIITLLAGFTFMPYCYQ